MRSSAKTLYTAIACSMMLLAGCSTRPVTAERRAQIVAACPELGKAAHKDMADLIVAYVDVLFAYHECRAAAIVEAR